jgi:hypothetical protein
MSTWWEENQQALLAALAEVRAALERHVEKGASRWGHRHAGTAESAAAASTPAQPPSAVDRITNAFGLTPFERAVLLLCAGVELDGAIAALCADAHADPAKPYATFSIALAALPEPHWSALAPDGPLRHWRLVEPASTANLTLAPLRVDERVLHYLAGVSGIDSRVAWLVSAVPAPTVLTDSQQERVERVGRAWATARQGLPLVHLFGGDRAGKRAVAAAAAANLGADLFAAPAGLLPVGPEELDAFSRLWDREAALAGRVLYIDGDDLDAGDGARAAAVARLIEALASPVVLSTRDPVRAGLRTTVAIEVPRPTTAEQETLWRDALVERGMPPGNVAAVAAQFRLDASTIRSAVAAAVAEHQPAEGDDLNAQLWAACRREVRPGLEGAAQRIRPMAGFADIVLRDDDLRTLREIVGQMRQRAQVYERWGFAAKGERGLGISALFAGPSGTGKTLAAEVVAHELHLDLYRVDLSQVVSKYIGETEKNLRRVFDTADEGGCVLLFDEADALFGKRSEVKDSHDRYANIEVSYLLQRMEEYRGLAVLTTNMKSALDTAFLRRLRFAIQFPFPDEAARKEIWRRVFPPGVPLAPLDRANLAHLNVAGGNIRNIAVHAAFQAADQDEPVDMAMLLRAAQAEYAKLEKPLTDAEIGGWL